MAYAIGDVVWLRRDTRLVDLRGRVGTNLGKVGDAWADADGEHVSVVYEDEQVLALDLAASEFVAEPRPVPDRGVCRPSRRVDGTASRSPSFQV